jgi:hypothetical protein
MEISEITRRDIVDYLILRDEPFYGRLDLVSFLKRIWDLSAMPSSDGRFKNAEGDIWQHMINNNDWDLSYLLYDYLDLQTCNDDTFIKFIEACLHPIVLSDEKQIAETLSVFNQCLAPDGYRLEAGFHVSGRTVYRARRVADNDKLPSGGEAYEVVLSFAGEDRKYVEEVATFLMNNKIRVFYDKYEEVTLWGKDLSEHLDKVYRGDARYCVMFISKSYAEKLWTNHERRSALAKALEEKNEYILPARFDNTEITGIRPTIGYVDLTAKAPEELGRMILQKLGRSL